MCFAIWISFFEKHNQNNALNIIDYQMNKINDKNKRYVEIIRKNYSKNYVENGIRLSLKYADEEWLKFAKY